MRIDLSTTSQTIAGLSSSFAANVGANDATVFNGDLKLSSANVMGSGTAKAFDITINLTTPFLYNPAAGNLLLDIRNSNGQLTGLFDAQADATGTVTRLVFS